ncbi:MAG TPA: DUF3187 family protein [Gammaproteobacteria bacterium]
MTIVLRTARGCAAALALLVSASRFAAAEYAEPFRTRNLSPLVSMFGVPSWEMPLLGTRVEVTSELANHYRLSRAGGETLILDGETWRTSVAVRHGFSGGWSVGAEIPYYRQSGGMLDNVIDAWHSVFNLPDGGRNRREEDQLAFVLADRAGTFFTLDGRGRGLGDLQLELGRRLGAGEGYLLQGTLKVPTGDEDVLAGSGEFDLAVTLTRTRRVVVRNRPAAFFWGVGGMLIGEPERIRFDARRAGLLAMLGGSFKPWMRTGFKAQLDVHSALYDSPLDEIGKPGVQATIGGWREINPRAVVEVAVNEDVAVSTSPDVVLHVSFEWLF